MKARKGAGAAARQDPRRRLDEENQRLRQSLKELQEELDQQLEAMTQLYEEVTTLYRMGELFATGAGVDALLQRTLQAVREALGTDMVAYLELEGQRALSMRSALGVELHLPAPLPPESLEGLFGYVLENKRAVIVNDWDDDPRMNCPYCRKLGIEQLICAPMRRTEGVFGFLVAANQGGRPPFAAGHGKLLASLADQAAKAVENARLYESQTESRRLEQELDIARQIQEGLLPGSSPQVPFLEVAGLNIPARVVGGDYYDYFLLEDHRFDLLVGDVAGKGVPAAMLMTLCKGVFAAILARADGPGDACTHVNRILCRQIAQDRFVTLVQAMFDSAGRRVRLASAGHTPVLHLGAGSDEVQEYGFGNLPLGIMEEEQYEELALPLVTGDLFLFYTDGVSEARRPAGDEFGKERIAQALRRHAALSAEAIVKALVRDVETFTRGEELFDDFTLVAVRVLGDGGKGS